MLALLSGLGHDVLSASDIDPRTPDDVLLEMAYSEERIVITEDKDFGELAFKLGLPHRGIIRFADMSVAEKAIAMRQLLERNADTLLEAPLIVVESGRVRITPTQGQTETR